MGPPLQTTTNMTVQFQDIHALANIRNRQYTINTHRYRIKFISRGSVRESLESKGIGKPQTTN